MKAILVIILFNFLPFNSQSIPADELLSALKRGNASQLAEFFDDHIQVELGDKKISYSKSQAELVIKDFFSCNIVKNFELLKIANSASNLKYCMGNLNTINGLFHTSVIFKQIGNKPVIEQIEFEK